ncbi:DUF5135 domain-containing protein [Mycobacterium paraseoulense]|nr:spirocyclase AveC family protein [Mycobacterium seoulense]MCV7437491.1 spirocyclase AveC family protein [Mycobacterium seoulense]BBZ70751.1 DUF5135 domain-containing protein [Mycobacterium paraseoulense]
MTTLERGPLASAGPDKLMKTPRVRTTVPIVAWATVGAAFIALAIYVASSWILGGRATPTPIGANNPKLGRDLAWNIGAQVLTIIAVIGTLIYVGRRCIRERRVTFDAILIVAYLLLIQWDPILNYVTPQFSYSSLMMNFGSWTTDMPGWVSPHGNLMPEPTILIGIGFIWSASLCMIGCGFLRKVVMRRWPQTGKLGIILWSLGFMLLADFVIETVLCYGHIIAYPNTVSWLTLFKGTSHQFPLYESLVWGGLAWAPLMVLRFYLDDRGHSVVERGVDRLNVSNKAKVGLQILAVAAVTNIGYLSYNIVMIGIGLQIDNDGHAVYPSHLINGICGHETPYPCPDPAAGRPISTGGQPGSPRDIPGDGRTWVDVYLGG